ncbi:FAD-dependent oxidoreductase [Pseudonocardia sp. TMWB2A]|uniref:FAD-dependent monooxygenase n=1 Tax=Pseudonocardia sp. TMWB2A TaxID=687430 RepID=UPI00307CD87B
MSPHALISGAGIAGPALAHQLHARGWRTTVVERATELREDGQNVDVRGTAREVVRRMGLEEEILAAGTREEGTRFVDDAGRPVAEFAAGRDDTRGLTAEAEILRGTLARLLHDRTRTGTEYRFGDRIVDVRQDTEGVTATLERGGTVEADVLVVADGTRSRTRDLVFDDVVLEELGLYAAYLTIPRTADDDRWWTVLNTTGSRGVSLRPDDRGTTRAALTFLSGVRGLEALAPESRTAVLRRTFADAGWQTSRVLDALDAPYYMDAIARVHARSWSAGRVVLLGDAAWSTGPFGTGTSLALTGAYVLAAELADGSDHRSALARYEQVVRPFAMKAQGVTATQLRAANPSSRLGLATQRAVLRVAASAPLQPLVERLAAPPADTITLPARYGSPAPARVA